MAEQMKDFPFIIKITKDPRLLSKGPKELLVAMRLGATPVPIPNTMVKP